MNEHETPDIFQWANHTDAIKRELDVEFFLFNKNYTPYHIDFSQTVGNQVLPLFLYDMINTVQLGAGTGLSLKDYDEYDDEDNTLLHTPLSNVGRADTLIHLIENERADIVEFSEEEHEFKRARGVVARFTSKDDPTIIFYAVKAIAQSSVLKGFNAWAINGGKMTEMVHDVAFKMPADNQVLIVAGEIFAFSAAKFEALFNYAYRRQSLVDAKVAEIEKMYKLTFPDGLDLASIVNSRKKAITKLIGMVIGAVTQEQAVEYADEIGLELMTDDIGSIIIMDGSDLDVFLNLINEDYATNDITGRRYEIKKKKELESADGQ
ncbi:MAG: hypothetical protein ACOH18_05445 [Candidatus Saccharimonadaceae bacterium]